MGPSECRRGWILKTHIWVKRHVGAALSSPSLPLVCLQGKRLPAYLSADAEEGEVSDDDSADEIEDDFKLKSSNVRIIQQCNVICNGMCIIKATIMCIRIIGTFVDLLDGSLLFSCKHTVRKRGGKKASINGT